MTLLIIILSSNFLEIIILFSKIDNIAKKLKDTAWFAVYDSWNKISKSKDINKKISESINCFLGTIINIEIKGKINKIKYLIFNVEKSISFKLSKFILCFPVCSAKLKNCS